MKPGQRMGGLDKHKIQVPPPAVSVPAAFDYERAARLIQDNRAEISTSQPTGAMEWLYETRSDMVAELTRDEGAADKAYHEQRMGDLVEILSRLLETYQRAWRLFNERPKVKQQGDLFS